jgi:outer membrane protein TolC
MALNAQLTQLCGVEVKKIDLTLPTLMSYEQIKSRALASNPFIKEAKLQISATEANFISAKRKRIPDLGVNVGFIKEKIPSSPSEYSVDVGLSFDLPVFNFNKKEIANTAYENQQKKMDLYEKERLLELQLIELHTKTKLLKQGAAVSYKKGEIAEKAFFIYRKGESTVNDLISTLHDVEEISISEIELNETIHYLTLELYAVAGFFENESINDTILGALK